MPASLLGTTPAFGFLLDEVGNVLTPEGLVACRNAFYAGSFSTYLRFEQAAMVGPAAVHTMMDETRAEFAER
jgi:hypothetical protein